MSVQIIQSIAHHYSYFKLIFAGMETEIKKSDFVLNPYMKSNDLWATYQIINTVVPYIG